MWMSFWQITLDNDVTGVEYRKDRRLPQALISSIMEKQLLINFFFSFLFFLITSTSVYTLTAPNHWQKHYTIKNIERRYHQHVYFHIKETMYIFIYEYWLRYTVICSLLVIIWAIQLSLIIELQSTMQTAFTLFFFSIIITGWCIGETDWSVVTEYGLQLTNIDCVDAVGI
jgi:hypothetical protein